MKLKIFPLCAAVALLASSCEPSELVTRVAPSELKLDEMAKVFSELPLEADHLQEVYDAVCASSSNGYDEEYMMSDLLSQPGAGVGDNASKARTRSYSRPLRDLLMDYYSSGAGSRSRSGGYGALRAGGGGSTGGGLAGGFGSGTKAGVREAEEFLETLERSDLQIYWPYSENWDGVSFPIISFDPGNGAESNYGYLVDYDSSGYRIVDSVIVDEKLAAERPVWIINRNDDATYTPLQVAQGQIVESIEPSSLGDESAHRSAKAASDDSKALYLRSIKMLQNYESWFGGASEFFVKCGAVNGFRATTDEDLKLYRPEVTDLMIVVKRSQKGLTVPVNALLLSEYTEQMDKMAFLVTEDDGGKTTSWKCSAVVKYKSKSFGFEMEIPYKDSDDIVWRGQIAHSFFDDGPITTATLGGVVLKFEQK